MSYNIALSSSMRSNLLYLRNVATQINRTQNIISTGLKISSAIDDATSYYQARSLTNRANDLNNLLDYMSQGVQTIQSAIEGLTNATSLLEQAKAMANQALASDFEIKNNTENKIEEISRFAMRAINKTYQDYLDEGYKEITATMNADEIQYLINDTGKLIFKENVTLSEGITISANTSIIGNGKTLTVNADNVAAITVSGKGVNADIKGLKIVANGTNAIGIQATDSGTLIIDKLDNVTVSGEGAEQYYYRIEDLFNGKEYTQAIYNQLSDAGSVIGTTTDYAMQYQATGVAADDANFGQGQWYIGALGEWTDLYGYDYANITGGTGSTGSNKSTLNKINATLGVIDGATTLNSGYYWSSSEQHNRNSWLLNTKSGYRYYNTKDKNNYVRCFQILENCFNPSSFSDSGTGDGSTAIPQIGDVMYSDKTWSSSDDYNAQVAAGKTAVGVIFDVDTINCDVKIVALNDAAESVQMDPTYIDITDIPNKNSVATAMLKNTGEIIVTYDDSTSFDNDDTDDSTGGTTGDNTGDEGSGGTDDIVHAVKTDNSYIEQFNSILHEFDKLIGDVSYQGINLLKGSTLTVTFNESRTNKFTISGRDISTEELGLTICDWTNKADIEKSIKELTSAVDKIREFQTELGNSLTIIQTRQEFTEALTDILEVGKEKLVLADMNEVSAEYLVLQTRQQLAINALSLASKSAGSILNLF